MSPEQQPEWLRREAAIASARRAVAGGLEVGSITVAYDSPASDTGQVWVKGECSDCGASAVMRASHRTHLGFLAMSVARVHCAEQGHDQRGQIELVDGTPRAIGSMSLHELVQLQEDAEDRLSSASQDLNAILQAKQRRFPEVQ